MKKITGIQIDIGFNTPIEDSKKRDALLKRIDELLYTIRKTCDCSGYGVNIEHEQEEPDPNNLESREAQEL